MKKDNVIDIKNPETFINDPISELLRQGARRLLSAALEAEIDSFLNHYKEIPDYMGCQKIVLNGYAL